MSEPPWLYILSGQYTTMQSLLFSHVLFLWIKFEYNSNSFSIHKTWRKEGNAQHLITTNTLL